MKYRISIEQDEDGVFIIDEEIIFVSDGISGLYQTSRNMRKKLIRPIS